MWSAVTRVKAIASESADRDAVREAAEDRLEQLRQRGLAEEADADRGHRDPDLAGGERLVDLVELLDHGLGAAFAFLGELLDLAAAAAHEGELGRDEEAVDRNQQQQEGEQQDAHRLCGPVLRGGSSSAIRRRKYSYPSRRSAAGRPSSARLTEQCESPRSARCSKTWSASARRPGSSPRPRAARRARGPAGDGPRRGRRAGAPRVIALEWLDPPYVGGHWVPEMISIAGGEDVAGPPGLKSPEVGWGALAGLNPTSSSSMPCGWYVEDAAAQTLEHWERIDGARRGTGLRGRRRLDLLAPGPAAGRRGRAARPPAPPRSGRPAGQHRLRRAAGALRRPLARRRPRATPIARPSPSSSSRQPVAARACRVSPATMRQRAEEAADEAAEVAADADPRRRRR